VSTSLSVIVFIQHLANMYDQNLTKNIISPRGNTNAATMNNSAPSGSSPLGFGPPTTLRVPGANTNSRPLVLFAEHPFSAAAAANAAAQAWPTIAEFTAAGDLSAHQGLARRLPLPVPMPTLVTAPKPVPRPVPEPQPAPTAPANPTAAPLSRTY
jgi:hypothetical protein